MLLAYEMNGGPLPPQHGFPLRLVVPGWYGMTNVKWLERIEFIDEPFGGYQQAASYRIRQTEDEEGEPLSRMRPRSLFVPPGIPEFLTRERTVAAGEVVLEGRAWSGFAPIASVEVSADGGATLGRGGAGASGRAVGLARLALRLAGGAGRLRPLFTRARRGRERAAARPAVEPRRLREQRRPARRGDRYWLSASVNARATNASTTPAMITTPPMSTTPPYKERRTVPFLLPPEA